ncbi:hypothetical protein ACFQ3S_17235 [Mucilaginibacter terrae]|uniref:hypothetical protein n=1 Tax=Mucilaginibacter terrae TaxID=1955052 RepID=UPI00363B2B9D
MKKLILIIILLTGIYPYLNQDGLHVSAFYKANAQEVGEELPGEACVQGNSSRTMVLEGFGIQTWEVCRWTEDCETGDEVEDSRDCHQEIVNIETEPGDDPPPEDPPYDPPTGGGGGGGGGGGNPPTPLRTDPCSQAAKNAAAAAKAMVDSPHPSVSGGLNDLKNYAGNTANPEYGMGFYKNTTTGEVTGSTPTSSTGSTTSQTSINLTPPPGTVAVGIGHDHSGGWAQSAGDIYALQTAHTAYPTANSSFVVGPNGQQYAMVVVNASALDAFTAQYPKANNVDGVGNFLPGSTLATDYNAVYSSITLSYQNSNSNLSPEEIRIEAHNAAMAYILESRNTGLALYEKIGDDYKVIKANKETGSDGTVTFERRPCF